MALPILTALFLEINAGVILLMLVCVLLHEATAYWDVRYATSARKVAPVEQHVHSFLEILPVTGLLMVIALHWEQFISLFGLLRHALNLSLSPTPCLGVTSSQ
jgi:hypothetical protein